MGRCAKSLWRKGVFFKNPIVVRTFVRWAYQSFAYLESDMRPEFGVRQINSLPDVANFLPPLRLVGFYSTENVHLMRFGYPYVEIAKGTGVRKCHIP